MKNNDETKSPLCDVTVLFPCDFTSLNRVDSLFAEEQACACDSYSTVLFDFDLFAADGTLRLNKNSDRETACVYRGWMMTPDRYESFYNQLKARRLNLLTDPKAYNLMHLFPHVYPYIKEDTPGMICCSGDSQPDLKEIKNRFPRFMIKDFVKSEKGTEIPSFFTSENLSEEEFHHWLKVFREYRGNLFTGGICIKEYVDLKKYDALPNEWRVFYAGHEILSCNPHAGQSGQCPAPPESLVEKYRFLPSPFYTIDYAELSDGRWMILETGDGSVSGLCENQSLADFYRFPKLLSNTHGVKNV